MSNPAEITPVDRFGLTLFLAVTLHAVVILGITFTIDKPKKPPATDRTLEIMVVQNPKQPEKPEKADFLAQTSQQGGGNLEEKARPTTVPTPPASEPKPVPVPVTPTPPAPPPAPPPKKVEPKKVLTQKAPARKKVTVAPKPPPKPAKKPKPTAAQLLASTNMEIARLTAELDRKTRAYAKKPRRKTITASTQEYKYANYLDAWKRKVERIGNLNYPDEAKRKKLFGNLVLHVAIRPDGSVKEINIRKSSGHKLLDDAAVRIVRLSAPFSPFPAEIRKEVEIIDIIRTWQFLSNNRLFSK
jgi:protein TonB